MATYDKEKRVKDYQKYKEKIQRHYLKNRDRILQQRKKHRESHKEQRKTQSIQYRESHEKHVRLYRQKYYERGYKLAKKQMIDYKGSKCFKCGYDKCLASLDFHHIDPSQKDFTICNYLRKLLLKNNELREKAWQEIKVELDKCLLLCANCHRELHYEEKIRGRVIIPYHSKSL